MIRLLLLLFTAAFLFSCSHRGIEINDVKAPVVRIQKAIMLSLPRGLRQKTSDGRIFLSNYYDPYSPHKEITIGDDRRFYGKIGIIGDRRPYTIFVEVIEERNSGSSMDPDFHRVGIDPKASEALGMLVKIRLDGKGESRDMIDEFKAF